jgi:hypothetical protein
MRTANKLGNKAAKKNDGFIDISDDAVVAEVEAVELAVVVTTAAAVVDVVTAGNVDVVVSVVWTVSII